MPFASRTGRDIRVDRTYYCMVSVTGRQEESGISGLVAATVLGPAKGGDRPRSGRGVQTR
ncbi:hypothetical protein ACPYPG_33195 [Streptomyces sp. FR-108]|uniref:hypothetical protein n=1 Tax=Streptomyces sp. FR-108 TaxID=3416665 RepID=UPI003CECB69F